MFLGIEILYWQLLAVLLFAFVLRSIGERNKEKDDHR
jgi:hypothetical protein